MVQIYALWPTAFPLLPPYGRHKMKWHIRKHTLQSIPQVVVEALCPLTPQFSLILSWYGKLQLWSSSADPWQWHGFYQSCMGFLLLNLGVLTVYTFCHTAFWWCHLPESTRELQSIRISKYVAMWSISVGEHFGEIARL